VRTGTIRTTARIFSPPVLASLADNSKRVHPRVLQLLCEEATAETTLGDAFQQAYVGMAKTYRSEYYYKNNIVSKIIFGRHSPRTASALIEAQVGDSIADVVVLNGTTTAYEVKSEFDNLSRAARQLRDYSRCFEHVYLVVPEASAAYTLCEVPTHVGVISVRRNGSQTTVRASSSNMGRIEIEPLYNLLRTGEAIAALNCAIGYEVDVARGDIWSRCRDLFCQLPVEAAHEITLQQLRSRGQRRGAIATHSSFPHSLRALAYATHLTSTGRRTALERLASPIGLLKFSNESGTL
jgi:hypothetical protein